MYKDMGPGGVTLVDRLRRKPVFFLIAVSVLLFYVTPFYYYNRAPYAAFPIICKNASCQQASNAAAGIALSIWDLESQESHPDYLVYTRGCKIMEMDPFDKSVKKFLKKGKPIQCSQRLAKLENQRISIDDNYRKSWKTKEPNCCYRAIHRVNQRPDKYNKDADWEIKYGSPCHHIPIGKEGKLVNDSFIKIECQGAGKFKGNVEFHGIALPPEIKSEVTRKKAEYWNARRAEGLTEMPPNILVIGIDSISRMHMIRSLPKTREFLQQNDFIELKGYNKVGENTFPNIMAGFGGMELNNYSSCWANKSVKLDDCPYIWKNFSDLNYITAFLEDSPGIAIFNFAKLGFVLPPADYYMRPLTVAIHKSYGWYRSAARAACVGGVSPTDYQANFIKELVGKMGGKYPYFLFSWFTSIGHDDFNGLKTADQTFLNLFSAAMNNSTASPDNTIMIFMSDHGYRFGNFRETFLGFYEESLPFFFFRLPPKLKEKHPDWYANLKRNSGQLTSPLDLHATLKQTLREVKSVLDNNFTTSESPLPPSPSARSFFNIQLFGGNEPTSIGNTSSYVLENTSSSEPQKHPYPARYSFFEYIHVNRTCESSSIPQRYCMCGVTPAVSRTSTMSSHLGDIVVSHINYMLQSVIKSGKCVALKFSKFLYGREVGHGEIWNNFNQLINYKDYLVALEAGPSKGHFESKIRILQNSTARILGDITRINSYQGQSECISDFKLKSYCWCKTFSHGKAKSKHKRSSRNSTIFLNTILNGKPKSDRIANQHKSGDGEESLRQNLTQGNNVTSTNRHIESISTIKRPT